MGLSECRNNLYSNDFKGRLEALSHRRKKHHLVIGSCPSVSPSHKWYESDPYIFAIQAHEVFYEEVEEQEEIVETTILEIEEEDLDNHQFHREDVEAQTLDPNVVFPNQKDDMDDIDDVNEYETLINYNNDDEEILQSNDDSDIDV
ncbi:hypothetical protein LWI28_011128 [Acer negundo]|uniref:Uncharacterized protein n=1 Tax=Acer negundo TaxID=4023 RepID=A0AAD5I8H8_ACENE|nr:hypothetical protein LWI28_011128 [Acer negundo]